MFSIARHVFYFVWLVACGRTTSQSRFFGDKVMQQQSDGDRQNPYRTEGTVATNAPADVALSPELVGRRPGGLTAVCVIVIVLGGLGAMASLMALPGLIFGAAMQKQMGQAFGSTMPDEQRDAYAGMMNDMGAVQSQWLPIALPATIMGVVVAVALIVGGVRGLGRKPGAGEWLRRILLLTMLVDIARAVINSVMQVQVAEVTSEYMAKIMGAQGGPAAAGMGQMMGIMTYVGIAFIVAWTLAKMMFYGFSYSYVGRSHVRDYHGIHPDEVAPGMFDPTAPR